MGAQGAWRTKTAVFRPGQDTSETGARRPRRPRCTSSAAAPSSPETTRVSAELAAPVLSDAQPRLSERKRAVPAVGALRAPSSSALAAEPRRPSVALPAGRRCRSIAPGRDTPSK